MRVHDRLLGEPAVVQVFSERAHVQTMLDVEVALAEAEAQCGVVPVSCVPPIRDAARVEHLDLVTLADETARDGNPVVPLVRHLTEVVAARDADAARYVHWGATSQDILDTALVLQLRRVVPVVIGSLARAGDAAAGLARRYVDTPMAGRTWLQQATPTTFGVKAAGWVDALDRGRRRLRASLDEALVLQLGGAAGTLASLDPHGPVVADELARRLELQVADIPWHAHRDRLASLAASLAVATGTAGKVARDIALLAQTEVAEVTEDGAGGRGVSSTMPQKRNPVGASVALAAASRMPGLLATVLGVMPQEHERGLGTWQAEWDVWPDLVGVAAGGLGALAGALDGLVVDPQRMRDNLSAGGGAIMAEGVAMALAEAVGKHEAHHRIALACRRSAEQGQPLAEVLSADPLVASHLSRSDIEQRLRPEAYLGAARLFVERVLGGREA